MFLPAIIAGKPAGGGGGYTGPLDIVPGAVVAYSQRAMAAAWVSNAITIREDGGDTTMSFPTTTNNAIDIAAVQAFLTDAIFTQTGVVVDTTDTITLVDATGVNIGQIITGANIPVDTTVIDISGAPVIQISAAATGTNAAELLTFHPNGFGSAWFDQSGNGVTLAGQGGGPGWLPTGLGGLPAFQASILGSPHPDPFKTSSFSDAGGAHTIFIVLQGNPSSLNILAWGPGTNTLQIGTNWNVSGDVWLGIDNFAATWVTPAALPLVSDTFILEFVVAADGTSSIVVNGVDASAELEGSLTPIPATATDIFQIQGNANAMVFSEVLVWGSAITSGNRTLIRQNIADYYSITLP